MMDDERAWDRILEVVRILTKTYPAPIPESLVRVSGNVWERDYQKRTALNTFLSQIPGMPQYELHAPLDEIADALDIIALSIGIPTEETNRDDEL